MCRSASAHRLHVFMALRWYVDVKVWTRYEEPKEEVVQENEVLERKISYKTVAVTEVTPELHFYAQNTETGESTNDLTCKVDKLPCSVARQFTTTLQVSIGINITP